MVDDYDYRIDDVDLELMYEVSRRIQDEWDGEVTLTSTGGYEDDEDYS